MIPTDAGADFEISPLHSLTNDGNAILREIEVAHPAAKSMIELSRTQDEEVGDGTTSVIILGKS
jgi:T-complex protein 1 subunit gamma